MTPHSFRMAFSSPPPGRRPPWRMYLVLASLALGLTACRECVTDERVYSAVRHAVLYPETFQQYVADNASQLNGGYLECSSDCAGRLDQYIEGQYDFCDEAHAGDPDFRNACYRDMDPFLILRNNVLEIRRIVGTGTSFNSTPLYSVLTTQKQANPDAHVYYNGQAIDAAKSFLVCRKCNRTFLGIDF